MKKNTKNMALSATLSAFSIVIMYVLSLFGKIDIAAAVIASLCVGLVLAKCGYRYAIFVYIVTALLSLLILPAKTSPAIFTAFFGYYPILKMYSESKYAKVFSFVLKYIFLNISVISLILLGLTFAKIHIFICILIIVAANLLLPLYDYVFSMALNEVYFRFRKK